MFIRDIDVTNADPTLSEYDEKYVYQFQHLRDNKRDHDWIELDKKRWEKSKKDYESGVEAEFYTEMKSGLRFRKLLIIP